MSSRQSKHNNRLRIALIALCGVLFIVLYGIYLLNSERATLAWPWTQEHTATVKVVVADRNGEPIPYCSVSILPTKSRSAQTLTLPYTDDDGIVTYHDLPAGKATLSVDCNGSIGPDAPPVRGQWNAVVTITEDASTQTFPVSLPSQ